jgi:hypothetical protein
MGDPRDILYHLGNGQAPSTDGRLGGGFMRRPGGPSALLALVFVALAIPADAQYRPPPLPEPEPPVDPAPPVEDSEDSSEGEETSEEILPEGTAGWGWANYVAVDGVYEGNVAFTSPPVGGDFLGVLTGSVTRWRRSLRSQWTTTLTGSGFAYAENDQLNRVDGGVTTAAQKALSARTSGGIRGAYTYGHTDTAYGLVIGGTVLPPSRMMIGEVGAGFSWRLGSLTDLSLDASWRDIRFDSERLQDSQTLLTAATLSRRLSSRNTVLLRLAYRRTEDLIVRHDPGVSVSFRRLLKPTLAFDVMGGASRATLASFEGPEAVPERWYFVSSVGLTGSIRRAVLDARYQHAVNPTVGYGVVQRTNLFSLTATVPIGRSTELIGTGAYAIRDDPRRGDLPSRRDLDFYVAASRWLSRQTQIVAGYRFRRRQDGLLGDPVRNDRASVSVVWGPEAPRVRQ